MKKPRSREHTALCLLAWSCLEFALGESLESPASTPGEETSIKTFLRETANGTTAQSNFSAQCAALHLPRYGFMYIDEGSGSSLGSAVIYGCSEGYQLVGNGKLTCLLKGGIPYWSHPPPHCEVIPKPTDKGFQVAVIASLISGVVIVTMSVSFAVCCLRDRLLRGTKYGNGADEEQQQRRKCKDGRASSNKQDMGKQGSHFGKLKHNRRLHYSTSTLYSCAYPGVLAGCSNQGFQRSQENLEKGSLQSLCSEIHIFPQVVLKPDTVPSTSMFVHLPQKQGDITLTVKPCHPSLSPDLPSAYYRRYEGLQLLSKQ